jgi:hypothetical protein
MVLPFLILVFSTALFFFYVQAFCERALRREFSHPYFQEMIQAMQLEFPRLRDAFASNASLDYADARLALKCDFTTLEYLLKRSGRTRGPFARREKILFLYFRFLLFCLPLRHALKLREKDAILKLAAILQYFANLTGERLSAGSLANAQAHLES